MTEVDNKFTKISMSVLINCPAWGSLGLLMVHDRTTETWGIPAGSLKPNEDILNGLRREILEEAGIPPEFLVFYETPVPFIRKQQISPIMTIPIPGEFETRIGNVYQANYHGPKLPKNGWSRTDEDIDFAKPFTLPQLVKLVTDNVSTPPTLSNPKYTFPVLVNWLINSRKPNREGREIQFLEVQKLGKVLLSANVPGLEVIKTGKIFPRLDEVYSYNAPFEAQQNAEAVKRKIGKKWGRGNLNIE